MKWVLVFLALAAWVAVRGGPARAAGIDCTLAATPVERAICADPGLRALDARLSESFLRRHSALQGPKANAFVQDQRDWLAARGTRCPTAAPHCLRQDLEARLAKLSSASQRRPAAKRKSARLAGVWKVQPIFDPLGAGQSAPASIDDELLGRDLPKPGDTVIAKQGEPCTGSFCRAFTWKPQSVASVAATDEIPPSLALQADTPAYVVLEGDKAMDVVVVGADHKLYFRLFLCDAHDEHCRTGFEVWAPVSPDARLAP